MVRSSHSVVVESDVNALARSLARSLTALKGTMDLMAAPEEKLQSRVYNMTGFSFTPVELANSIRKVMPEFEISYAPDFRQVRCVCSACACLEC